MDYLEYLPYCTTEHQRKILKDADRLGSLRAVARERGVSRGTIGNLMVTIKNHAARKGFAPEHDMTRTVPDGFAVKGVSTLYDKEGNQAAQWVKSTQDHDRQVEIMREAVEAMKGDIQPCPPTERTEPHTNGQLANLYVITDYHIGSLAWGEETRGDDWDTSIAEQLLTDWFSEAVRAAPAAHTGVLCQLGDMLHYDSLDSVTPTSKHVLDSDSRFQKVVRVTIRVIRKVVAMMLGKHEHVHIVMAEGNHDLAGSAWMRELMAQLYSEEPRVHVDCSADPYYCFEWGQVSLFMHHGHKRKPGDIDHVFASKFRDVFGRTKHSYAHMGHMHHVDMKETNLMIVEQHRTLAANDSHASRLGYSAGRSAPVITYHREYGEVGRITITPEMVG